jgi:hypothetical protein
MWGRKAASVQSRLLRLHAATVAFLVVLTFFVLWATSFTGTWQVPTDGPTADTA